MTTSNAASATRIAWRWGTAARTSQRYRYCFPMHTRAAGKSYCVMLKDMHVMHGLGGDSNICRSVCHL